MLAPWKIQDEFQTCFSLAIVVDPADVWLIIPGHGGAVLGQRNASSFAHAHVQLDQEKKHQGRAPHELRSIFLAGQPKGHGSYILIKTAVGYTVQS